MFPGARRQLPLRALLAAGAFAALAGAFRGGALVPRCATGASPTGRAQPTSPNYCVTLIPAPGLDFVTATLVLQPSATPFGAAVTREGRPRYELSASIAGLPDPATLGPYHAYVAWAYTLAMDSAVKLGQVRNGDNALGELARDQFRVVITAESSAQVRERSGRIVVRGTSPAARTLAHRDLTTAFTPGVLGTAMQSEMPDMPDAFVPGSGVDVHRLPAARTPINVQLRSGDTLTLTASMLRRRIAGHDLVLYGYNGQVPGPTLRVTQGATIIVKFHNAIDLPSAVHWHGVRVEARYDGAVGISQPAVPPGGEFTYVVRFPDAGVFWYHAHEREDIQQESGLFGNIVVAPRATARSDPRREELIALSDLSLTATGIDPYGAAHPTHALMGRYGDLLLVNGAPSYALRVMRGEVVRFLITDASNARVYNLSFAGARMKLVATDQSAFARESWVESIVIAPAERYVVDVRFDSAGTFAFTNRVQALDHPSGTIYPEVDTLGSVTVERDAAPVSADFARLRVNAPAGSLSRYRAYVDSAPAHLLELEMRVHGLPAATMNMLTGVSIPVDWNDGMGAMNREATGAQVAWALRDPATGRENMDIDWRFPLGALVKVRIYNDPDAPHPMDHPIHVHGQRMLLLARNGVPNAFLAWKDTILIPAGEVDDVLIEMSDPGRWMLHCHIAEHRASGMMMAFQVDST